MNHKKIFIVSLFITFLYIIGGIYLAQEAKTRHWISHSKSGKDSNLEVLIFIVCILPLGALNGLKTGDYKASIFCFSILWIIFAGIIYLFTYLRKKIRIDNQPSN
jgi:uncharacterized membrane protein HdeD (DUF308 family)